MSAMMELQRQINDLKREMERLKRVEKPALFLPFTYLAVPASGTTSIALASVVRRFTYISWTQAVQVATTNNASNYWTVYLSDNVTTIASFDTSANVANQWYTYDLTSLTQPSGAPSNGHVFVGAIKVGAPGNLYWGAPAVRVF